MSVELLASLILVAGVAFKIGRDTGGRHCDLCLHVTAIEDPDFDMHPEEDR